MALDINISGPYQRTLPGGQTLTFARGYDVDGVWMRYWETHTADSPYRIDNLTYDEYEEYRQQHPELNMPELKPPPPATNPQGNTQGRVNGETPATGKSAEASRTTVESETPAEDDTGTKILDGLQTTLDVAGLIPGVGEIADLANAGISLARGDYAGAALSLVSAIPFAGWFGTAGKAARRGAKAAEEASTKAAKEAADQTAKEAADKAAKEAAKKEAKEQAPGAGAKVLEKAKKLRERYLGRTPGKNSRTGREVQERMRAEGKLKTDPITGETKFQASDGSWHDLSKADMAHKTDAVSWWNKTGRKFGAKSPEVRKWMLDSKNYTLDHYSLNRSAGAKLGERYLPPLK
ncbi:GH-E family nuclease [Pseudomonas aeruginosa]|uniref:GH-E family nuclease n=1 Tax=Pseudomonas aeruginosa TaxID=287 RepID=UPI0009A3818C|nr:GH-E family nuclease [Pseudomonas aeruginosa]